jgi:hypothetical protein
MLTLFAVASANAGTLFATTSTGNLLRFDSATPGTIDATVSISGLQAGESLLGIDFRPASGVLYGLGSTNRLYTIDPAGAATQIGGPFALNSGSFGFDFNPTVDRIRVVNSADDNIRLNPVTGALAATDTSLAYGTLDVNAGQDANVVGSGYTNSFPGAMSTTLFGIDAALGVLVTQIPPNAGTLNTIGALGVLMSSNVGFDIAFPGNLGFAALQTPGGFSSLYSVNLTTGQASLIGAIGNGEVITGLSASAVPEPASVVLVGLGLAAAVVLRKRSWRLRGHRLP